MPRVGVIGTFVWDVIHGRDAGVVRRAPVEEWGGITYALAAFEAALPPDWQLVPIVKVGDDLADRAQAFLRSLPHVAPDAAPVVVPYPNNRVELVYRDEVRRSEVLRGGVPGWTWVGLAPLLQDLDALYVNLISGWEVDLGVMQLIRQYFRGPIYCDLHSLVLGLRDEVRGVGEVDIATGTRRHLDGGDAQHGFHAIRSRRRGRRRRCRRTARRVAGTAPSGAGPPGCAAGTRADRRRRSGAGAGGCRAVGRACRHPT